jgi:hypothetical protein
MTSEFKKDQLRILVRLTELDELVKNADPRSIRWLYDRYDGAEQFAYSLETEAGINDMIRFFDNEPDILAEMDNTESEWDG